MLVLSRKLGESIQIEDVRITVVRVDRNRVKIGIEAPREKKIMRGELAPTEIVVQHDEPDTQEIAASVGV